MSVLSPSPRGPLLPLALLGALVGGAALAWRSMERAALLGHLLELALLFLFIVVPTIARTVFSAFACDGFGYDDADATDTGAVGTSAHFNYSSQLAAAAARLSACSAHLSSLAAKAALQPLHTTYKMLHEE